MARQDRGLTYKRMGLNITEDMERIIVDLRKKDEFCRCSYAEIIRILITEGIKNLSDRYPDIAE